MQGVLEIVSNERSRQKYQIFLEESRYGLGKLDQNDLFYRAERSLLANKLILSDLKDKSTDKIAFASINDSDLATRSFMFCLIGFFCRLFVDASLMEEDDFMEFSDNINDVIEFHNNDANLRYLKCLITWIHKDNFLLITP